MSNSNKTALITGSSWGIGYEFAKLIASKGYDVILSSRNSKRLKEVKREIELEFGVRAYIEVADLSKPGEATSLYNRCKDRDVNVLINNAGAGLFGSTLDIDLKNVEDMLFLNIQSLTILCTLFSRDFKSREDGNILNVGSLAGNQPTPFFASYAASKSYVLNYSLALREELKPFSINVSCIQPGYVRTSFDNNSNITSEKYKKFSFKNSLSAKTVAIVGLSTMFKKRAFYIPGVKNRVTSYITNLLGKRLQAKILNIAIKKLSI